MLLSKTLRLRGPFRGHYWNCGGDGVCFNVMLQPANCFKVITLKYLRFKSLGTDYISYVIFLLYQQNGSLSEVSTSSYITMTFSRRACMAQQ